MILHGKNIIVSMDDTAIAAAKSCTINIAASTIPTASPISGSWESHIPARKSWSVKTSHLLELGIYQFRQQKPVVCS